MIQIEEPNGDVPNSIVSNPSEGQMVTQKPVRIGENCYQNAPKQLASPQQQLQRSFQGPDLGHHHRPPELQQQHQVPASETALRAISSPSWSAPGYRKLPIGSKNWSKTSINHYALKEIGKIFNKIGR